MSSRAGGAEYLAKLADYYRWYAAETFAGYEPHYDQVCRSIADSPDVVALIGAHPEDAQQPNVILAAARFLLADEPDHPLAQIYAGESSEDPGPIFCELVLERRVEIDALMSARRTQTNEIARSAPLALGLAEVHRRTSTPLAWIDLGCSAGLNLHLDRLRISYRFADRVEAMGNPNAALAINCDVLGGSVEIGRSAAPIGWRLGIDRAPISPTAPADARWLRACVFPSKAERSARLDAALALAQTHPVELRAADAADGIIAAIADAPADMSLVVTTSWVWYYLPVDTRAAVLRAMRSCGRSVHWLSIEGAGVIPDVELGHPPPVDRAADGSAMVLWSSDGAGSDHYEFCGWAHHHGAWVDWRLATPTETDR